MGKHTMFELECWEDEEQRTRAIRDYILFYDEHGGTETN